MSTTLHVPELGEDIDAVQVVSVLVKVGDTLSEGQGVIEVETEKAAVEIPAEEAGTVTEIFVGEGDNLSAGAPILAFEPAEAQAEEEDEDSDQETDDEAETEESQIAEPSEDDDENEGSSASPAKTDEKTDNVEESSAPAPTPAPEPADDKNGGRAPVLVPASPSVRRFAREIGVDITRVKGSGPGGRLSHEDVKDHARSLLENRDAAVPTAGPSLPDFSRWGEVREEKASTIRRITAERMSLASTLIPQVTNHELADITELEAARKRLKERVAEAGGSLTMTAVLVRVMASALARHPQLNTSYDGERAVVIHKSFIHIGVAVDTPHGLLVPVVRDADRKNIATIAKELSELAARARERKLQPDEMDGATFSISNLGGIGGTAFSPIVNWPQAAILGVSRGRLQPVWTGSEFEPRLMLPLSLSYDHRLVDGAEAARFLEWTREALADPLLLAVEG